MTLNGEFQAVVLAAGRGSRFPELTVGKPKCLLPVGPKPLVWYPLLKLQQSGFTEAILVVPENHKNEIQNTIEKSGLEIKIDYFSVSDNEDLGTADTLRLLHDKLKSDVLIFSCDLITDVSLLETLSLFRKHNASISTLLFDVENSEQVVVPGPKSKYKQERDLIGVDKVTKRLIFLASASDFESDVSLLVPLIRKHTDIEMYSNLIDSHVYVLKNWIIKYLKYKTNISTLKGELLPHIVKKQSSRSKRKDITADVSVVDVVDKDDIFSYAMESELDLLIKEMSTYNDHLTDMEPSYHGDTIRCYAHIAEADAFGVRVNTLPAYWSVNAKILDKWETVTQGKELAVVDRRADVKSNQVDKCIVWESAKLKEKTSFKSSVIGANTQVGSFSRVFNSIVMSNVTISERVALENCIICDGAKIEAGCTLKGCLVGSQHTVPEGSEYTNEVLTNSDRLMEF